MKSQIKQSIQKVLAKLYPDHQDIEFDVSYAPENIDADYASNIALVLAKKVGEKPMAVAEAILANLPPLNLPLTKGETQRGWTAQKPGFLNFKLEPDAWHKILSEILDQSGKYGYADAGKGKKVNVESVSANPTGPLTVGHGRGAIIGQVLANVFRSQGFDVVKDYYYNDAGLQMKKLGESVKIRVQHALGETVEFPEDLYQGEYIKTIADSYIQQESLKEAHDDLDKYASFAAGKIFNVIKQTLSVLGVTFDRFVKESEQKPQETLKALENFGIVYEKDGAKWLKLEDSDEDRVLVRSTGEPTYRLPDIAYHAAKVSEFDKVIDVLGADHIAQFPDIQYALSKLGLNEDRIDVIINQFVTLGGGKKMSTRKAEYVTLDELTQEVGADVTKFFLSMTSPSSHMTFDLELARDNSEKNPVYKVQYAHARINSILEKTNINPPAGEQISSIKHLADPLELEMIKELSKYPELLQDISENHNIHHLPHYLLGLADKLHSFYERIRVITDDEELTMARLGLVKGVQIVLANGLRVIGIEPLKKM